MIDTDQTIICDHLEEILTNAVWQTIKEPSIFTGLSLWDPENQPLPVITILPRIEKALGKRYGKVQVELPVEITALVPLDKGQSAMIGVVVAEEIAMHIFRAKEHNWGEFPESLDDIDYSDGGIIDYPDELNPQMVSCGITINVKYTKTPFPYTFKASVGNFAVKESLK